MARTRQAHPDSPHVTIRDGNVEVEAIPKNIMWVARRRVLVGIPAENDKREGERIGNAALAYIHEFGSPLQGIPPRPHMVPGVQQVRNQIEKALQAALLAALEGKATSNIERYLHTAGQVSVNSIRGIIQSGQLKPLSEETVRRRRQRSKGSKYRRKAKSVTETTPLYDTGTYVRHITYVVRTK